MSDILRYARSLVEADPDMKFYAEGRTWVKFTLTQFEIDGEYAKRFPVQVVGGRQHEELWVPAEELEDFNRHIIGQIKIVAAYYGAQFAEEIDMETNLPKVL